MQTRLGCQCARCTFSPGTAHLAAGLRALGDCPLLPLNPGDRTGETSLRRAPLVSNRQFSQNLGKSHTVAVCFK